VEVHGHGAACRAAAELGIIPDALQHGRGAVAGYRELDLRLATWECRASVASALLAGGQREQANAELESLLAEASQHAEWNIAYEAHALLYRVLAQVGDARARELLDLGYRALCSLADRHADLVPRETMMRGSFLRRELCAAWEAAALASAR